MEAKNISLLRTISSLDELSSRELALLLKFLISKEKDIGGPYLITDSAEDYTLNLRIYNLFAAKGKFLPNALAFAENHGLENKKTYLINEPRATDTTLSNPSWKTLYNSLPGTYKENTEFNRIFNKLCKADSTGEISRLSKVFYRSVKPEYISKKLDLAKKLSTLSSANQYTWLSYTLYDNILDEEENSTDLLPIANYLQRQSIKEYSAAGIPRSLIYDFFDTVDLANHEELRLRKCIELIKNSRRINLVSKGDKKTLKELLYKRSVSHVLGPHYITQQLLADHCDDILHALRLYCLAKQLNDDIHDWVDDLESGRYTYVIQRLINTSSVGEGQFEIKKVLKDARSKLWVSELISLCNEVVKSIDDSVSILETTILQKNSEFANKYLHPLKNSAIEAKNSHEFSKEFLKNYRS